MPALDVSDILADPDFCDTFWVRRRREDVGDNGRASFGDVDTQVFDPVQPGGDNDLARQADQQHAAKTISVITRFRLQGPAPDLQADLIYWGGDWFIVEQVEDWSRYGAGYVRAQCSSVDHVDQPPQGA